MNLIFWGMIFFTDYVGFHPVFAGLIMSLGTIWDAVTDPTIGYLSDIRNPRKGRRRPFLLWSAVPLGLVSMLVFTNFPWLGGLGLKIYFVFFVLAFYTCQTCVDVPYTALGTEITQDYDERSSLSAFRGAFYDVGLITSSVFLFLVVNLTELVGGNWNIGWSMTGLLFGVFAAASLFIVVKFTKGYELLEVGDIPGFNLKRLLFEPFSVRPFRYVVGLFVTISFAGAVLNATLLYYLLNYIGADENLVTILLLIGTSFALMGVPVINFMSRQISKKASWVITMSAFAVTMIIYPFFVLTPASGVVIFLPFLFFTGNTMGGLWQLIWAKVPDCVEVDEFQVGKRREGLFYGILSLSQKVSAGLALLAVGVVLDLIGYDAQLTVQGPETLGGLKVWLALGTAVPATFSVIIAVFNPMTRKRHANLNEALAARHAGKEYSIEGFRQLLNRKQIRKYESL